MRDIEKKLLTKLYINSEEDTEEEVIIGMKRDLCIETLNKIKGDN